MLLVTAVLLFSTVNAVAMPTREAGDGADGNNQISQYEDPAALAVLIETGSPDHVLIDVRTPDEYKAGYIPTAVNIPVDLIGQNPPEGSKDQLLIVYCRSGNRSARAADILRGLGYSNIVDFGGISRWDGDLETGG